MRRRCVPRAPAEGASVPGFYPLEDVRDHGHGAPHHRSVEGEAAQILQESKGALVVPAEDAREIAKSILQLRRDGDLGRTLGERGRRFVVENYSRRSLAFQYLEVVSGVMKRHSGVARCGC